MLNPFFQQGSKTEQSLIQDLINEQLRMYGVEVYYIPRKYLTTNAAIREAIESKFDDAYPIEAYVNTYEGYDGQGTILSKFGVQPLDDLTLTISKERFEEYITPLTKNLPNIELATRPKEGDLVYFPLGDRLFEIKFVEHEKPFYQLQKNYVYQLTCELFRYEDEVLDTGIDEIDDNIKDEGYIQTLTLVGTSSTATANTYIVNGGVRFFTISNRGDGYSSEPRVAISSAPLISYLPVTATSTLAPFKFVVGSQDNAVYVYDQDGSNEVKITNSRGGFGRSVAIGHNKIVAGSDNKVYVYDYDGSNEVEIEASDGDSNDYFGYSVAIDNNKIVVGSLRDDDVPFNSGSVYVYDLDGTNEVKITASDAASNDEFGQSVAIGNSKIVVGVYQDDDNGTSSGSAYIYDLDGTNEVKITASDAASDDQFGRSVAVGNNKVVVSAQRDNDDRGAVYVYDLDGTNEVKITASDAASDDFFGNSVAVGNNKVVVGAITDDDNGSASGSVYVYDLDGTNEVKITASDGASNDRFGNSVSVGNNKIIVGAEEVNSDKGAVYVYDLDGTNEVKITASDGTFNDHFGRSVAAADISSVESITIIDGGGNYKSHLPPTITFTGGGGSGATATATVSNAGIVTAATVTNPGSDYTSAPTPVFTLPAPSAMTAVGIATMIGDLVDCSGDKAASKVQGVEVANAGYGYTVSPSVAFFGGGGAGAAATATIGDGVIGIVTVTGGGSGYTTSPQVTFTNEVFLSGVTTASATAHSYINGAGIVTAVYITNAGLGYSNAPTVSIANPIGTGSTIGIGTFAYNEVVTGSVSGSTARVREWDSTTTTLELGNLNGDFVPGDVIMGSSSGATYKVRIVNTDNLVDPYAQNDIFETEGDNILDFTEGNPFGTPS